MLQALVGSHEPKGACVMSCPHIESCGLYPELSCNSALKVWQVFYCEGQHQQCVRFQHSQTGKVVPVTLLPNGNNMDGRYLSYNVVAIKPLLDSKSQATQMNAVAQAPREEHSSFYLRISCSDASNFMSQIETVMGDLGLGVAMKSIKSAADGGSDIILVTGDVVETTLYRAIVRLEGCEQVLDDIKCIALEKSRQGGTQEVA